ncbi:MAG: exonuclease domain-containing protein [Gammaproteobacteria bacterium]|nr:exonuclease domain-containing protein [Gammaproteobacteria bacterium]
MWDWLLTQEQQRRKLVKTLEDNPLRDYYRQTFVSKKCTLDSLELVSVDLETTGFNPQSDAILSIGQLEIRHNQIELATAQHTVIRSHTDIDAASAVVHGITDDRSAAGISLRDAVSRLLASLAGKVMLVHYSSLEQRFLNQACQTLFGGPFIVPIVDTLYLARRRYQRQHKSFKGNELRLHNLRAELGLPRYQAHNALSDALATAELYLVQIDQAGGSQGMKLSDILSPRHA